MRPFLLKGHERPLTYVKYSREGDLLFTCAKDKAPNVWFADNGERLGTYNGHNGAVLTCDLTSDTARLVTASADMTMRLWDTETGVCLSYVEMKQPLRSVNYALGEREVCLTADPFMGAKPSILVYGISNDTFVEQPRIHIQPNAHGRIMRALWGPLNETIVAAGEDGYLRLWDPETCEELESVEAHSNTINGLTLSADGTQVVTASTDKSAKLWDVRNLKNLKTYMTDRPCNSASISPIRDHVLLGGGQDASQVTTTSSRAGKFEAKFFHKIFEEEFGAVKGHFGPLNTVSFSPDGRGFTSGGEDGYVRLHHFDPDYFSIKF